MKPYVYLIGWKTRNTWYYGSKYGKKADPDTFWIDYFTSSKYVSAYRILYGEPDVIEIRKIFDDPKKAKIWETKVLRRMKVVSDNKWLNRTISDGYPLNNTGNHRLGTKLSIETKKKISIGNTGKKKPCSDERKDKLRNVKKGMRYNYDDTIRHYFNISENIEFLGSMCEFCEYYNLDKPNVFNMIKGKNKSVKGWKLK